MKKLLLYLILLNVAAFCLAVYISLPKYLEVDYLDVGQGDAIFIQTPDNHQIIIDGGPDNTRAIEDISSKMPIWDKTIDLVVLTHPDTDHLTGLLELFDNYQIENIIWSGAEKDNEKFRDWKRLLEKEIKEGAKEYIAKSGEKIIAGDVTLDILYPFDNNFVGKIPKDVNDTSVVTKMLFKNSSFIFTGDISSKIEDRLSGDLSADILKVAHHGSKYSTSDVFLKEVNPKLAIIQVGKNSYGHPGEEVLTRLNGYGIKILRNDINGDIKVISDGNNYKIITNK